jgi:TonB family C-terminal domain
MRNPAPTSNAQDAPAEAAEAELAKKPSLGAVRLSAPKVTRNASASETATAEPGLAMNGVAAADSSGLGLLANKSKGPAAPLAVGGDVKVAKLLSSVPPVYPQMARTQRVSGDVTIDALIDVNGRVSTMRVISGPALLRDAAMSAVRQWKYQSATLNGVATATHLTVTVQFRLQ